MGAKLCAMVDAWNWSSGCFLVSDRTRLCCIEERPLWESGAVQIVLNTPVRDGAQGLGNAAGAVAGAMASMWVGIFRMTSGSSMQAMTFMVAPQVWQVLISMSNTRLRRFAQAMTTWRSAGVRSLRASAVLGLRPLPRPAHLIQRGKHYDIPEADL